jgi:hypothetical protein
LGFFSLAASIIPYFILKNNVHPLNVEIGTPMYAISESWNIVATTPGYPRILIVAIFSGLGLLPLIILSNFSWSTRYLRTNLHWGFMVAIGIFLLFGGKDKSRLFLHMLPAITILALGAIRDIRARLSKVDFIVWLAITTLLHVFMGNLLAAFSNFHDYLNRMVPEHSGTQGGQGFTRVALLTTLFFIANYVLQNRSRAKTNRESTTY